MARFSPHVKRYVYHSAIARLYSTQPELPAIPQLLEVFPDGLVQPPRFSLLLVQLRHQVLHLLVERLVVLFLFRCIHIASGREHLPVLSNLLERPTAALRNRASPRKRPVCPSAYSASPSLAQRLYDHSTERGIQTSIHVSDKGQRGAGGRQQATVGNPGGCPFILGRHKTCPCVAGFYCPPTCTFTGCSHPTMPATGAANRNGNSTASAGQ